MSTLGLLVILFTGSVLASSTEIPTRPKINLEKEYRDSLGTVKAARNQLSHQDHIRQLLGRFLDTKATDAVKETKKNAEKDLRKTPKVNNDIKNDMGWFNFEFMKREFPGHFRDVLDKPMKTNAHNEKRQDSHARDMSWYWKLQSDFEDEINDEKLRRENAESEKVSNQRSMDLLESDSMFWPIEAQTSGKRSWNNPPNQLSSGMQDVRDADVINSVWPSWALKRAAAQSNTASAASVPELEPMSKLDALNDWINLGKRILTKPNVHSNNILIPKLPRSKQEPNDQLYKPQKSIWRQVANRRASKHAVVDDFLRQVQLDASQEETKRDDTIVDEAGAMSDDAFGPWSTFLRRDLQTRRQANDHPYRNSPLFPFWDA